MSERDYEHDLSPWGLLSKAPLSAARSNNEKNALTKFQQMMSDYWKEQERLSSLRCKISAAADEDKELLREKARACADRVGRIQNQMNALARSLAPLVDRLQEAALRKYAAEWERRRW